jgi:zinc transport system substrate-binding protein
LTLRIIPIILFGMWARAATVILCLMLSGGCAGEQSAQGGRLSVVAGFYPVFEAADRVAGDRADVLDLTPPGAEPHDIELSSRDVDQVLDADLLLYLGGGFQPAVEELAARREGPSVDLLEGLPLREGAHEEEGEDHPGEEVDPHVWLDPLLMAQVVDRIAAGLSELDPPGSQEYARRAGAYAGEIRVLHQEYEQGLATCDRRILVTAHDAFGYLADRYGLEQEGIAGLSPEAEPDPKRLAELTDLVRSTGTTTVFTETLVSPEVAQTLGREAGVATDVLDPLESAPDEGESRRGYVDRMRSNLASIVRALGCTG